MTLYLTGFGAFGPHEENPTTVLAKAAGEPYTVLPVTFQAVEDFLTSGTVDPYDAWLMLGVHGSAEKFHLETRAQNHIGPHPDVDGIIQGPAPIDPRAPYQLSSTIWSTELHHENNPNQHPTIDAGSYLCNYILFRALQTFPEKRLGFLHVPSFDKMCQETQLKELKRIVQEVKSAEAVPL